jgi:hypothetical protein
MFFYNNVYKVFCRLIQIIRAFAMLHLHKKATADQARSFSGCTTVWKHVGSPHPIQD